jgi:hypothetical protein
VSGLPAQLIGSSMAPIENRMRFRKPNWKLYMNDQISPLAIGGMA